MSGEEVLRIVISGLAAYMLGNINPSIIIGKIKGIDIRKEGSGNAGTKAKIEKALPQASVEDVFAVRGEEAQNQQSTVEYTESARDQVSAVSQDEELTQMIKLQNAYNASSRYINAISEMLEHVITRLGS